MIPDITLLPRTGKESTHTLPPLGEGEAVTVPLHFTPKWCRDFLKLSGDINLNLHDPDGDCGIVQGAAIISKISAVFSQLMPGFAVASIGELKFQEPVCVGDTMELAITRLNDNPYVMKLRAALSLDAKKILETEVILVDEGIVIRKLRDRRR